MTEAEWLAAKHPYDLIYHKSCRSDRKRRLLACACARRVLHFLPDLPFEQAISVSETYADGSATEAELRAARREVAKFLKGPDAAQFSEYRHHAAMAVRAILEKSFNHFKMAIESAEFAQASKARPRWDAAQARETREQLALTRCIFANPFRPVAINRSWLNSSVIQLARAIYEERRFGDLPILADALEEAGCTDPAILAHCRGPGPHARGCWVLDLILGKT
jgi:hypothetical protein